MISPIFNGRVENGKLYVNAKEKFATFLTTLNGDIEIVVRRKKKRRSTPQNAWYFGAIIPCIMEVTGFTKEETHDLMKLRFNKKIVEVKGHVLEAPGSTQTMSTLEFSEFIEKVRNFAATELDCVIPDPETIINH